MRSEGGMEKAKGPVTDSGVDEDREQEMRSEREKETRSMQSFEGHGKVVAFIMSDSGSQGRF